MHAGVEGCDGREATAGLWDGVVTGVGGIGVAKEDGGQVSWAAGQGEASAVLGGGRGGGWTTEEFLPPGSVVGAAGLRGGGVDTEGLKEDVQPALVLLSTLAPEPEDEEKDVGEEGNGPEQDGEHDVGVVA